MSNKAKHAPAVIVPTSVPPVQAPPYAGLNALPGAIRRIVPPQAPAHNWIPQDPTTQALLRGARI